MQTVFTDPRKTVQSGWQDYSSSVVEFPYLVNPVIHCMLCEFDLNTIILFIDVHSFHRTSYCKCNVGMTSSNIAVQLISILEHDFKFSVIHSLP